MTYIKAVFIRLIYNSATITSPKKGPSVRKIVLTVLLVTGALYARETEKVVVDNSVDPVYQLPIGKYPKFSAEMILKNGTPIDFVSVKAMMNFYFHPEKYPEYAVGDRSEIDRMYVKDYLDGKRVRLKNAWFVFGSRIVGPHGDDLIPFSSKTRAEMFVKRYGGSRIMRAEDFTFGLIHYLDM